MKAKRKLFPAMRLKWVICLISIAAGFSLAGGFTYQVTKAEVTVLEDGNMTKVRTHDDTVGELLNTMDIEVAKHDEVSHKNEHSLSTGMKIHIKRAKQITVNTDGSKHNYYTTEKTVDAFLEDQNIQLSKHDDFSHTGKESVTDGLELEIKRAYPVTINDGGKERNVWTTGGSVGNLLAEQGIELKKLDELKPAENEPLHKDVEVTITRVKLETEVIEETQAYATVTQPDETLDKGVEQVVSKGEEGIVAKHYRVRIENGKETERKLIKEVVKQESKQEVVALGTKVEAPAPEPAPAPAPNPEPKVTPSPVETPVITTASTTSRPASEEEESSETLYMHSTAYSADCTGCSGKTATGINLKENPNMKVVAVDPSVIPLGTKVWVEGYGTAVAGDTGGAINGNRIDVHMSSRDAALGYGSKQVEVKIID